MLLCHVLKHMYNPSLAMIKDGASAYKQGTSFIDCTAGMTETCTMAPISPCVCILIIQEQGALGQNSGEQLEKDNAEKGKAGRERREMAGKGSTPQSQEEGAAKLRRAEKENGLKKRRARNPRLGKAADPCADQAGHQAGHTAVIGWRAF